MNIRCVEPMFGAWERMLRILFKPFDIVKWFVLGVGAWLTYLFEGYSGFYFNFNLPFRDFFSSFKRAPFFSSQNPLKSISMFAVEGTGDAGGVSDISYDKILYVAIFALAFLLVLFVVFAVASIVLYWVKSVAEFVFIGNISLNRAEIVEPFKKCRGLGTSAFLWRIALSLIALVLFVAIVSISAIISLPWIKVCFNSGSICAPDAWGIAGGVFFVVFTLALSLSTWCAYMFFRQFVMPVMLKNKINSVEAFGVFFGLLKKEPLAFAKYVFCLLGIRIIIALILLVACAATCCIAYALLLIPYLWAVATLPALVFVRLYSMEFIAQFGDEFNLFPDGENLIN